MSDEKAHKDTQASKFKETARDLEADEDEKAFDRKLKELAKTKPEDKPSDD